MKLVILPQALRVIIPPLISQYLNITKNSSLAIAVGYADITATLGWYHPEPDRSSDRMRSAADVVLSHSFTADFDGDEHLQRFRQAEGALSHE